MASTPGEWYAEQAAEAERLGHELAGARKVLAALDTVAAHIGHTVVGTTMHKAACQIVRRLERELEQARDGGD